MDLTGTGAELHGGRWNSKGTPMVYTSQPQALAFAELAMHIPAGLIPRDYYMVSIHIPGSVEIFELKDAELPTDWRIFPHADSTQITGDEFVTRMQYAVMRVPSAVVPGDHNFLLNPKHPAITKVKITGAEHFEFDSRFAGIRLK